MLTIFDTPSVSRYKCSNNRFGRRFAPLGIEVGDREKIYMGSLDSRAFARKARPILWKRDYDAAKGRLLLIGKGEDGDERFLALLSELTDYERRNPSLELVRVVEWAECVFVPVLRVGSEPARRWSDGTA